MGKLEAMRKKKGLKQKELAEMSGVRAATISLIENGKGDTNIRTYIKLANALKCKIDDIV